jgi:hypothetical protein
MKESHIEGVATHDDPESCADGCEAGREALTGAHTGSVLSREITISEEPTLLCKAEGETSQRRYSKSQGGLARSQTRHMCGTSLRENREIPSPPVADGATGRSGKAFGHTPEMHGGGKSDRFVVCAEQRVVQEGSSPSDAQMRSVISEGGGSASPAE